MFNNSALPYAPLIIYGLSFFRVQHFFFDLFCPLGIFSVPLGLLVGGALFVLAYSLIITWVKENIYYGFKLKEQRSRRIKIIIFTMLAVAVIGILLVTLPLMQEQY